MFFAVFNTLLRKYDPLFNSACSFCFNFHFICRLSSKKLLSTPPIAYNQTRKP